MLEITRGDTFKLKVTVYTDNTRTALFDLTGHKIKFTVKTSYDLPDIEAVIAKEAVIAEPVSGVGIFTLSAVETNIAVRSDYHYDIQVSSTAGDFVDTIIKDDILKILPDITRDI